VSRVARASELIGQPVVTLDGATTIGEVRDVLFDPERSRVVGFTLRGRGLLSSPLMGILPGDWVRSIGRDAIMIESEDSVVRDRDGMQAAVGDQQEIIGKEVVTDAGKSLGTVSDIVLEVEGPAAHVVGYELDRSGGQQWIVPISGAVPVSGEALVLPADAERDAVSGLSIFRESLDRGRERPPTGVGA
jgi:sporulation protein YlmC with PRC-barrel domain